MQTFRARTKDGKILDYRVGKTLDLEKIRDFFSSKYSVKKLWPEKRHVVGILEKDGQKYFLKVATTEGIGVFTQTEFEWNKVFNQSVPRSLDFWVPKSYEQGIFQNNLTYSMTEKFEGKKLVEKLVPGNRNTKLLVQNIDRVIDFSEAIQSLEFSIPDYHIFEGKNYKERYSNQVYGWFTDVPKDLREKYQVQSLLDVVEQGISNLLPKPKHGDFAPWHIFLLSNGKLGLIDGEHAISKTVEYYDICYMIQRIFTVIQNPDLAQEFINRLKNREYGMQKVKTVLASRAIGGFLDEYLGLSETGTDFIWPQKFKEWVLGI